MLLFKVTTVQYIISSFRISFQMWRTLTYTNLFKTFSYLRSVYIIIKNIFHICNHLLLIYIYHKLVRLNDSKRTWQIAIVELDSFRLQFPLTKYPWSSPTLSLLRPNLNHSIFISTCKLPRSTMSRVRKYKRE